MSCHYCCRDGGELVEVSPGRLSFLCTICINDIYDQMPYFYVDNDKNVDSTLELMNSADSPLKLWIPVRRHTTFKSLSISFIKLLSVIAWFFLLGLAHQIKEANKDDDDHTKTQTIAIAIRITATITIFSLICHFLLPSSHNLGMCPSTQNW